MQAQLFNRDKRSGALFSECKAYRYFLWRIWDESKPVVMFIGLNPYQFVPEIMGFAWNEDDHNILTVVDILFAGAETQYHVIRQYQKA